MLSTEKKHLLVHLLSIQECPHSAGIVKASQSVEDSDARPRYSWIFWGSCRLQPLLHVWAGPVLVVHMWAGPVLVVHVWAGPVLVVHVWAGEVLVVHVWAGPVLVVHDHIPTSHKEQKLKTKQTMRDYNT